MYSKTYCIILIVYLIALTADHHSDAINVEPTTLCPSNKIAPNRRRLSIRAIRLKTFGHISSLFSDGNDGGGFGSQGEPQDEEDDCGDIEDYDETDLSSLTSTRRPTQSYDRNKFFFNLYNDVNRPQYQGSNKPQNIYPRPPYGPPVANPGRPPQRPPVNPINQGSGNPSFPYRPPNVPYRPQNIPTTPYPVRPQRPPQSRPPYSSGGIFENNPYRPPYEQYPSDQIKPIHEVNEEPAFTSTYRPIVVGGPIGSVVGIPARPIRPPGLHNDATTRRPINQNSATRKPRDRIFRSDSIIGSFIDLLLK